jgi:hypothetical protein
MLARFGRAKSVNVTSAILAISLLSACTVQAQPDRHFDGIWYGTETLSSPGANSDEQKSVPPPHDIAIAIAQGGTQVGILGGVCPGRYTKVRHSGNTLTFGVADCQLTVTLSPDGKTLTEQGSCRRPTTWMVRMGIGSGVWPVTWLPLQIKGVFHR